MIGFRIRGGIVALGLLSASVSTLGGCGFFGDTVNDHAPTQQAVSMPCPATGAGPLTLVVGARANSPQPGLPPTIQTLVHDAALAGQHIQVVLLDGAPAAVLDAQFSSKSQNPQILNRDLNGFVTRIGQFVATLRPKAPQADVLTALSVAGQYTAVGGTVVLLDSGVPTTGPISFQDPDMFAADPADVATFLGVQKLLPALGDKSVVFVGLGQTVEPQPRLATNVQTRIADLWLTLAKKAGATCEFSMPALASPASVSTALPVAVVQPRPAPVFRDCGTTTLGEDSVGFVASKSEFRDPAVAETTLRALAQLLVGHDQQIELVGSVSSEGDPSVDYTLSLSRAEAVKQALVGLGVDPSRITTKGDGIHAPGRLVDLTPQGVLIPAAAAHNRSVTVNLTCRS